MAHPRSAAFGAELQDFLSAALPVPVEVVIGVVEDGLRLGTGPFSKGRFTPLDLSAPAEGPLLKVEYKLADDESGAFCRVLSSTFGLFVPADGKPESPQPVVRVEYERSQKPPTHVHFHASSQPLGWLYGVAGGAYRPSDKLHFPIGSQRFRPTIEEFLLFIDAERIFRGWRPDSNWRSLAIERIKAYEASQAVSLVRYYPEEIAAELTRIGWSVQPPPGSAASGK